MIIEVGSVVIVNGEKYAVTSVEYERRIKFGGVPEPISMMLLKLRDTK